MAITRPTLREGSSVSAAPKTMRIEIKNAQLAILAATLMALGAVGCSDSTDEVGGGWFRAGEEIGTEGYPNNDHDTGNNVPDEDVETDASEDVVIDTDRPDAPEDTQLDVEGDVPEDTTDTGRDDTEGDVLGDIVDESQDTEGDAPGDTTDAEQNDADVVDQDVPEDTTVTPCSEDLLFNQIGNDCNSGIGECNTPGLLECVGADVECVLTEEIREPSPEICDGLDNDCDGTPDNIGTRYIGELFTLDIEMSRPDGISVLFSCGLPDACEPIVDATCDNNPDAELIDTLNVHVVEYDDDPRFGTLHFSAVSPGCYDISLVGINQKITWVPGEESCVAANQLNILRQGDEYTYTVRVQGAGQPVVLQSIAIPFTITENN